MEAKTNHNSAPGISSQDSSQMTGQQIDKIKCQVESVYSAATPRLLLRRMLHRESGPGGRGVSWIIYQAKKPKINSVG